MIEKEIKLTCNECDSHFKLEYHEDDVEDYPTYCPFCGSRIDYNNDLDS